MTNHRNYFSANTALICALPGDIGTNHSDGHLVVHAIAERRGSLCS